MTRFDKIIFTVTVILSLFVIIFSGSFLGNEAGRRVIIEVDGEIYGKYEIESEKTSNVLEIKTKYGYNKVVIDSSGAYVAESDCHDKNEVKSGRIENAGEMLVCLPNRLIITIAGESEVDGVAY